MMLELPLINNTQRKIIHLDMDAFYAQIEMRDHPAYREKALMIGRDPRQTGGHGVVATANYRARKYGVHSAMSSAEAEKLVPAKEALFIAPNFPLYREISDQIHVIFKQATPMVESVALDEAYLDVTDNLQDEKNTIRLAQWLQHQIFQQTALNCSVGISYNKFLAKLASEYRKPQGRAIILPEQAELFLQSLPVKSFPGVGLKTQERLAELGIETGADLRAVSVERLIELFGKMGYFLYQHVRGIDNRPVEFQRDRRSLGKETTFDQVLTDETILEMQLRKLAHQLSDSLNQHQLHGRTVVLKWRHKNFVTQTKSFSSAEFVNGEAEIYAAALQLWQRGDGLGDGIRLLGITLTELSPQSFENLSLFD